jgi:hypothetical protein
MVELPKRRFRRRNKYGAKKCVAIDGTLCDSRVEALYYNRLIDDGRYHETKYHQAFQLLPRFSLNNKQYSRRIYTPDFAFYDLDGSLEKVVDVKGGTATMTEAARLRIVMFMQRYKVPVIIARYDARTGLFIEEQA